MSDDKRPDLLKPLWTGESIWCANCGHHVNRHKTGRVPLCNFDDPCYYPIPEKGRYECNCKEFVAWKD